MSCFNEEVYEVIREIPYGSVVTYGQIARLVGKPQCSRMVGRAMFHAPESLHSFCHRVINSQGRLVPGWDEQRSLLEKEGITFKKNGCVDLKKHNWKDVAELSKTYK
ncbi:MGMT family protein [Coprobacter sp.]